MGFQKAREQEAGPQPQAMRREQLAQDCAAQAWQVGREGLAKRVLRRQSHEAG